MQSARKKKKKKTNLEILIKWWTGITLRFAHRIQEVCTGDTGSQQTPWVSCFRHTKAKSVSIPHSRRQWIPILQLLFKIWSLVNKPLLPVSLSLRLFVGELQLTVPNVAIQLWSRAVLQGCHDRINENNITESHFIHITGERTQDLILKENVSVRVNSLTGIQNGTGTKSCRIRVAEKFSH